MWHRQERVPWQLLADRRVAAVRGQRQGHGRIPARRVDHHVAQAGGSQGSTDRGQSQLIPTRAARLAAFQVGRLGRERPRHGVGPRHEVGAQEYGETTSSNTSFNTVEVQTMSITLSPGRNPKRRRHGGMPSRWGNLQPAVRHLGKRRRDDSVRRSARCHAGGFGCSL